MEGHVFIISQDQTTVDLLRWFKSRAPWTSNADISHEERTDEIASSVLQTRLWLDENASSSFSRGQKSYLLFSEKGLGSDLYSLTAVTAKWIYNGRYFFQMSKFWLILQIETFKVFSFHPVLILESQNNIQVPWDNRKTFGICQPWKYSSSLQKSKLCFY